MRENIGSSDEAFSSQQPVESAESCIAYGDPPSSSSHRLDDDENVLPMYSVFLSPISPVVQETVEGVPPPECSPPARRRRAALEDGETDERVRSEGTPFFNA
jgi:hypothetical protein